MQLKYDFSIQEIADNIVAMAKNRETEAVELVFNLNETGALILEALQDGQDVPTIANRLVKKYGIQPEEAEADVDEFIGMLQQNGWATT